MVVRAIRGDDLERISEIHEKHYNHQFELPNFLDHYLCAVVVGNDQDDIITVGGVRTIVEAVAVTDLDRTVRERRKALINLFPALRGISRQYGYQELHAFIQTNQWQQQLAKAGFRLAKGNVLRVET